MQANFAEAPTAPLYFFILPGDGHAAKWVRRGASCLFVAATELCPQDPTQPRVKAVECLPQKPRRKNWHGTFNLHSCKMKSVRWDNELHILWTILSLSQNKVQGQGWRGGGVEGGCKSWRQNGMAYSSVFSFEWSQPLYKSLSDTVMETTFFFFLAGSSKMSTAKCAET